MPVKKIKKKKYKYFEEESNSESNIKISSGFKVLDCAIGGGYIPGTMINIVGDTSSGKTLEAIDTVAYVYHILHQELGLKVAIDYNEPERALDRKWFYKHSKIPKGFVRFVASNSVEELFVDVSNRVNFLGKKKVDVFIYVIDSWDALTTVDEMDSEIEVKVDDSGEVESVTTKGSYKVGKAKFGHEFFRRLTDNIKKTNCLFVVISQAKKKIGVSFGNAKYRAGGDALNFYATHILFLSEQMRLYKTIDGVKRDVGCRIFCKVHKNKRTGKRHTLLYDILDDHGIDDLGSCLDWLVEVIALPAKKNKKKKTYSAVEWGDKKYSRDGLIHYLDNNVEEKELFFEFVKGIWDEIEEKFKPDRKSKW